MTPPPTSIDVVDGLAQLSLLVFGRLERLAAERGLSLIQTRLLGVLRDRRPTMNELASLLGLDKSSASGLVDRAQRRGLVAREPSPRDGRSVLVTLTASGRALGAEVAGHFAKEVATLLGALAPEQRERLGSLVNELLIADATTRGIDLFDTTALG